MTKAQKKRLANKKAKLRKINKAYKLDDSRARHFVLCVIIGLIFMTAVVYAPIIPESYIKHLQLPGEEITYPNEIESSNVKLPEHIIILGTRQEPLDLPKVTIETKDNKSIYERVLEKDGTWIYKKIEEKKKLITKKKVKNFAIMQVLKLFLGIPIIPGQ